MTRPAYTLVVVLWVLTAAAALALVAMAAVRSGIASARNRVNAERAYWHAEDCVARARAAVDAALDTSDAEGSARWRALDSVIAAGIPAEAPCLVTASAAGVRVDINAADSEQLARALTPLVGAEASPPLIGALLDWRDADDEPGTWGTETSWYAAQRRPLPRNGSLADLRELARVRGFDSLPDASAILDVEGGRIALANAPGAVLASVPGFTDEIVQQLLERQRRRAYVGNLLELLPTLSRASVESLSARYSDIARLTTPDPDAWIIAAQGRAGGPMVTVTIELRLVRRERRAAIVRRRILQ